MRYEPMISRIRKAPELNAHPVLRTLEATVPLASGKNETNVSRRHDVILGHVVMQRHDGVLRHDVLVRTHDHVSGTHCDFGCACAVCNGASSKSDCAEN